MEKKELVNLTESELLSINGGTGFLSKVGELIGDGLAYAAQGLSTTSTASQVRWYNHNH
ncbi:hypothetical protein CLOBY_03510 [Clostridium saccharobutylicum]|uniref:hypothetical protein n=1 Tax=Clostridium saccharobutylicum TaxID=169679 RepID=UPI000983E08B|nr:hypothetical protein [Clostridium saccharobutylicum]AQS08279.1 hypothetical protein CLOBY_03510 [Clostridium saccharobutylicum]MBC2435834.1 hypothetical protein [Clostridium saccharobutylicum]NSB88357.1 hypothetical protein [Clostridium saccharobutylicum]NYC29394.1 hypothetical protein [Clostridium saccharobutylicum]OOM10923.1 hypothetical protein CLSAB_43060 [Clostridium saccharobutylicum]